MVPLCCVENFVLKRTPIATATLLFYDFRPRADALFERMVTSTATTLYHIVTCIAKELLLSPSSFLSTVNKIQFDQNGNWNKIEIRNRIK